jgi:S-methylmethionine-dependent homocysteine/selenocysteine methylase
MSTTLRSKKNPVRLLDGGMGSELRRRGVSLSGTCWSAIANLSHAEIVAQIHEDYVHAGADIVTANTFATTRFLLASAGLEDRFEEINRNALCAARNSVIASNRKVSVAGSLSCMPPRFDTNAYPSAAQEYAAYLELVDLFVAQQTDLILVEMMQSPAHAELACTAASQSGLPFWIGLSCRLKPSGDGLTAFDAPDLLISDVLDVCLAFAPAGIAIMHSPVAAIGPALEWLKSRWNGPTGAWAEIPYPQDPDWNHEKPVDPADYAETAGQWLSRDLRLLGGCCGTGPEHIAALRTLIDSQ